MAFVDRRSKGTLLDIATMTTATVTLVSDIPQEILALVLGMVWERNVVDAAAAVCVSKSWRGAAGVVPFGSDGKSQPSILGRVCFTYGRCYEFLRSYDCPNLCPPYRGLWPVIRDSLAIFKRCKDFCGMWPYLCDLVRPYNMANPTEFVRVSGFSFAVASRKWCGAYGDHPFATIGYWYQRYGRPGQALVMPSVVTVFDVEKHLHPERQRRAAKRSQKPRAVDATYIAWAMESRSPTVVAHGCNRNDQPGPTLYGPVEGEDLAAAGGVRSAVHGTQVLHMSLRPRG